MGNFYVSHTLKTSDQQLVMEVLRKHGRTAAVSQPQDGIIIVLDEKCDSQDTDEIERFSAALSAGANSAVFAVLNHDDDVLMYWLCAGGVTTDRYNSFPGYFEDDSVDSGDVPTGGEAAELARTFGKSDAEVALDQILRADQDSYVFAVERHEQISRLLGLPWPLSAMGYGYLEANESSPFASQFTKIG